MSTNNMSTNTNNMSMNNMNTNNMTTNTNNTNNINMNNMSTIHLYIPNWTNNIDKKFLCPKYGENNSPSISWTYSSSSVGPTTESFALILQDIHPIANNYIHWYIPSINKGLTSFDSLLDYDYDYDGVSDGIHASDLFDCYSQHPEIKVKQGLNSNGSFGYYGPCAPKIAQDNTNGNHEYVFYFYALDKDLMGSDAELFKPKTSKEFESLLRSLGVKYSRSSLSGFFNPYKI